MPALCILCAQKPPIENSHIVPNFVVKRLKAGNPLRTLVHSDAIDKTFQDAWKGNYLCTDCEEKFSGYERWFCNNVYDPHCAGIPVDVSYSDQFGLFAASLAFRYIWYALDRNSAAEKSQALFDLEADLRGALKAADFAKLNARSYLQFLEPVTVPGSYPPGINTYIYEAIDAKLFTWVAASSIGSPTEKFWLVYIKLPGMFVITSLFDRRKIIAVLAEPLGHRIEQNGRLQSAKHTGNDSLFVKDILNERAIQIQADYERMSPERLKRNQEKIAGTPKPEDFRAHRTYMLDMKLLEASREQQVQK